MLGLNQIKRWFQEITADSTSCGALMLLTLGVSVVVLMMWRFSTG
jgi:hypothetical protein